MKTICKLLFFMASFSLLFSCQKSDPFGDELSGNDLKSAPGGVVITVEPTGTDDTENMLKAFADAEAAGPGTTIQLVEGDYFTGAVEIYGFHGTVKGAGTSKTIMNCIPGIPVEDQLNNNQCSAWWRMIGGDVTLSDMTFKTPDGSLVKEGFIDFYGKDLYAILVFNNYNDLYFHPDEFQKVEVTRVDFYGGYDNPADGVAIQTDHNVLIGIWIGIDYWWPADGINYSLTKGRYVINDCFFEHFGDAAEGFSLGENASMVVENCVLNKNWWPLFFTANYNSDIVIKNNTFSNTVADGMYEIGIWDADYGYLGNMQILPLKPCRYTITGNTFNTTVALPAIVCNDYWVYLGPEERLPMQLIIEKNVFNLSEGSGIHLNNSQNALVRNNRFTGSCTTGIAVDGFNDDDPDAVPFACNNLLLGNNFSRLTSSVANVYLGEKSKDCTVVGSSTNGLVIDNGVNNKITGMHKGKPGLKLGPSITDNFRLLRGKP